MLSTPVNLFNSWDPTTQDHDPKIQEIVLYCASRLRAIVLAATQPANAEKQWLLDGLIDELVGNPVICKITICLT